MAHQRRLLGLGADHEARRVAQRQDRQVEGVAQLHEARRLVAGVGVDRAAQVAGVVRDQPHRPAFDAHQRGEDADAEFRAQLEHRVLVGQRADHGAHVVHAQPVLGDQMAQRALVGAAPFGDRALEVAEQPARRRDRLRLVVDQHVDHAVGYLHRHRAHVVRRHHAQATALDHRRPRHADRRVAGRDDQVAAAQKGRIAGEAVAVTPRRPAAPRR